MSLLAQHFVSEYHDHTTLHPLGLAAVLVLGVSMLWVPRRFAAWPMIIMACFVSSAQRVVIASLDFDLIRLMLLFGLARVFSLREWRDFRWRGLDTAVVLWATAHLVLGLLRAGPDVLVNKLGMMYDVIGLYFLFRMLIRDWEDVQTAVLGFSLIAIPVAMVFAVELSTGHNMFSIFGGVNPITWIRDGRMRCQGAFAHPVLAGVFWASLLPLIAMQWFEGRRWLAVAATSSVLLIIAACGSATPVTGIMFAAIGTLAFPMRYWMRGIRWTLLLLLVGLHFVMNAPVWHLISRINIVGGNSGYHRFLLIDSAINNMHEWWLIGSQIGTSHWGYHMFDVTNYYIVQGLHGGLLLLALFVAIIALAFRTVGRLWRVEVEDRHLVMWSWALGVSLFVHATGFIAISYFGQINMLWYMLLAILGSLEANRISCVPNASGTTSTATADGGNEESSPTGTRSIEDSIAGAY